MDEKFYEDLLNINTMGEKLWDSSVTHYHPYQATSYIALDILFKTYNMDKTDNVVDFGCGKGRLIFYLNSFFKCNATGIEMDETYYKDCLINKENYLDKHKRLSSQIDFNCILGQDYQIKSVENKFYFFNPFSVTIFRKIVNNILDSYEKNPRVIDLILYYPSEDYIYFLENNTGFSLYEEVKLHGLYEKDCCERFLIYRMYA
ncbi:class I SAM-dependent methyltransferase [Paraclostridium bifermentans]|uniref:class I SAM-dependent methyltransferase n=1 Tax=Paraclostridium bifermentans TaxID=1490 RepID=UPI00387B5C74